MDTDRVHTQQSFQMDSPQDITADISLPFAKDLATAQTVLDAEDLGRLLRLTTNQKPGAAAYAVNQRIHRGYPMPPWIVLPRTKKRIWLLSVVLEWLEGLSQANLTDAAATAEYARAW